MEYLFLTGVRYGDREWTVGDEDELDDETALVLLSQGLVREIFIRETPDEDA